LPTYTYKCTKCNIQFDTFQSIADSPLESCPSCHGKLRRVITGGSGLIFKGSGFYITDYARKSDNASSNKSPVKKSKNKIKPKSDS
jgi:putative FmdB family regulatory protein